MILTCPECATRFKIADDAIGSNGRTVRCSQCSTTWFVAAEPDLLNLDDAEKTTETRETVPSVDADIDINIESNISGVGDHVDGQVDAHIDDEIEAGAADIGAHAVIRENADRKKARRRYLSVGMIWAVTLAILALFALAAFLLRAKIVEKFPGTAPIYKAFNLEANSAGLDIYDIETRYGNNEGVQVLFLNGKIKNFDVKARDVNMIRFSFKNEAGEVLASWVVEPSQSRLKPGEVLKFVSQYPNPPIDAVKLAPAFITETASETPVVTQ